MERVRTVEDPITIAIGGLARLKELDTGLYLLLLLTIIITTVGRRADTILHASDLDHLDVLRGGTLEKSRGAKQLAA